MDNNIPFEIKIGGYEVLASGSIVSVKNEPVSFNIGDLSIEFTFSNDASNTGLNIKSHVRNNKSLQLEFINFNNSLGSGNKTPIRIGSVRGKAIFLMHTIYAITSDAGKIVHYTWLLSDEGGVK